MYYFSNPPLRAFPAHSKKTCLRETVGSLSRGVVQEQAAQISVRSDKHTLVCASRHRSGPDDRFQRSL